MTLKKQLGKKIQELRKKRKITQEKFAEMVGIDAKNISKIENGYNYPSAETITSIAKALHVEIYELFLFKNDVPIEIMRNDVIQLLNDNKNVLYIHQIMQGI